MKVATITIDDEAYQLLKHLKAREGDSFSKVILRDLEPPFETCGELLDWFERTPPPQINVKRMNRYLKERGRRRPRR
jgi:hypothetical protein